MRIQYAQSPLPETWDNVANVFDAMGDTTRQRILLLFEPEEELSIKQISDLFDISRTSIVYHLSVLEAANLIVRKKKGRDVLFHLNKPVLMDALTRVITYAQEDA